LHADVDDHVREVDAIDALDQNGTRQPRPPFTIAVALACVAAGVGPPEKTSTSFGLQM
jgi:hypothetical protein